jgi:hypothetical protein
MGDWIICLELLSLLEVVDFDEFSRSAPRIPKRTVKDTEKGSIPEDFINNGRGKIHKEGKEYLLDKLRFKIKKPVPNDFFSLSFRSPSHIKNVALGICPPPRKADLEKLEGDPKSLATESLPHRFNVLKKLRHFADDKASAVFALVGDAADEKQQLIFEYLHRKPAQHRAIAIDCNTLQSYDHFIERLAEACLEQDESPQTFEERGSRVLRYLQVNPVLLILYNLDVHDGWNADGYHTIRNDNLVSFLLHVSAFHSQTKVLLSSSALPAELSGDAELKLRENSALITDPPLSHPSNLLNDYRKFLPASSDRAVTKAYADLREKLGQRAVSRTLLAVALTVFALWTSKSLDPPIEEVARRLRRRSLGGLVWMMFQKMQDLDKILLGYIAASEDGIFDSTFKQLLDEELQRHPTAESSSALKARFLSTYHPLFRGQHERPITYDFNARLRRTILYQWEKAIVRNDKVDDAQFFTFNTKQRIHHRLARQAIAALKEHKDKSADAEILRLKLQLTSQLLQSIDGDNVKADSLLPLPNHGESFERFLHKGETIFSTGKLQLALSLLLGDFGESQMDGRVAYNMDAAKLGLLTRLFSLGRTYPAPGTYPASDSTSLSSRLPFLKGRQKISIGYRRLLQDIFWQMGQAAFRTHHMPLAKSAADAALQSGFSGTLDGLQFEILRLDVLIAQGYLSAAETLADDISATVDSQLSLLLKRWEDAKAPDADWIKVSNFFRLRARMAYLQLLRGDPRSAHDMLVYKGCDRLDQHHALSASFALTQPYLSFTFVDSKAIPRGLGAHVLMRAAKRAKIDGTVMGKREERLASLASKAVPVPLDHTPGRFNTDQRAEALLDQMIQLRMIARDIPQGVKSQEQQLEALGWAGQVSALTRMRLIQERARNALFLYTQTHNREHLLEAIPKIDRLAEIARARSYPLMLIDALLMSIAARREAINVGERQFEANIPRDQQYVQEMIERCSYRLRWLEFDRVMDPDFKFDAIDAQAWG